MPIMISRWNPRLIQFWKCIDPTLWMIILWVVKATRELNSSYKNVDPLFPYLLYDFFFTQEVSLSTNNRFGPQKRYYRVINLRMPKSKPLLSHYLLSEHVFILGTFNQFSAYILIFEIGFLIFQNLIFGPKWWDF